MKEQYNKYFGSPNRTDYVVYLFHSKSATMSFGIHYNEAGEVVWVYDMTRMINPENNWTVADKPMNSSKEEFTRALSKAIKFLSLGHE